MVMTMTPFLFVGYFIHDLKIWRLPLKSIRKPLIGEYKIDIQLSQFPKNYKFLSDIMIENTKSISGFSQIDHIALTPYGIFVIETKNYQGTIYGGKKRKTWLVNGKFKMMNPLMQNFGHIQAVKQIIGNTSDHKFISLITFTKRCTLKIGEDIRHISSDEMVIYDFYLTETIQRKNSLAKLNGYKPYSDEDIEKLYAKIVAANITDPIHRQAHNEKIQRIVNEKKQASTHIHPPAKCVVCNEHVSQKVSDYCLQHKNRFKGKIYCLSINVHDKCRGGHDVFCNKQPVSMI